MSKTEKFPKVPKGKGLSLAQRRTLKRWLDNLVSGKYVQTAESLKIEVRDFDYNAGEGRDYVGHCCLGVLCETKKVDPSDPDSLKIKPKSKNMFAWDDVSYADEEYDTEGAFLMDDSRISPGLLERWTGLEGDLPDRPQFSGSYAGHLASLNDAGMSFKQIANIVERRAEAIHPGWREGI